MGYRYILTLLAAGLAIAHSACHFEQYINSTIQTPNTRYVQWKVNLHNPPASRKCPSDTNRHRRQGVLQIKAPSDATKVIIQVHQEGETCFASWHLAMDWTNGHGGSNAELHNIGYTLCAFGRSPGPGPIRRAPEVYNYEFVSRLTRSEIDIRFLENQRTKDQVNEVERVYPGRHTLKARYANQNMFRVEELKSRPVYLGLNRVVNGARGREGTGLYYVCVDFET